MLEGVALPSAPVAIQFRVRCFYNRNMTDPEMNPTSPLPPSRRREVFLTCSTLIVTAVVPGIILGAILSVITGILLISAMDQSINTTVNGWSTTLKCGQPRHGVLLRAACAKDVSALSLPQEEVYWQTFVDSAGRRLNGQNDYILHFPPAGLPPNGAAWSVTMGDFRRFMIDNPIHRYSLGGRSGLVPNADGSIDIYLENTAPTGHEANWLPSPSGQFMLWLRVYQPGAAILRGEYHVPPVVQVKGGSR
jgi:hypothetical protein